MKLKLVLFFLVLNYIVLAQDCNIIFKGTLTDFHDGTSLEGAIITLKNGTQAKSSNDGIFIFKNVCPGEYTLTISHPKCELLETTISLYQNTEENFILEHHIYELDGIKEKGSHHKELETSAVQILDQEELSKHAQSDIGTAIAELSGVSSLNTGKTIVKPIIHGLHSSRVLLLNNGIRQEDQEWGVEHGPSMDINAFANLRVIKGTGALRYGGDAVGGVVMADYPNVPKDTLTGNILLSGNTNGRGGIGSARIAKGFKNNWSVQLQGSFKKFGDFEVPNYVLTNTGIQTEAFSGQVAYNSFKIKSKLSYSYYHSIVGILRSAHIGNLKDLAEAINSDKPFYINPFSYNINYPKQDLTHHLLTWDGSLRLKNLGTLHAQYGFQFNQRYEYDIRTGADRDTPAVNLQLTTHGFSTFLEMNRWSNLNWEVGFSGQTQDNFANPDTGIKRLIPDYDSWKAGAYTSLQYKLNSNWVLDGGLRYDFNHIYAKKYYYKTDWDNANYDEDFPNAIISEGNSQYLTHIKLDFGALAAVAGVQYKPNEWHKLNLQFGLTNRPPNSAELFSDGLHHSAAAIEKGDLRLDTESSKKITFNYIGNYNFLNGTDIEATLYWNRINNFINQIPTGAESNIRGAFPVWSYLQVDANLMGLDLDLNQKFTSNFSWKSRLSYLYAQDKTNDIPLINMPATDWANTLRWNDVLNNNYFMELSAHWNFKQNRYPNYNFDISYTENGEIVNETVDISTPPDSYVVMNFLAGKTFKIKQNSLDVQFGIENIWNKNYRNYLNRLRYYADELGRNFQLKLIYNF